MQVKVKYKGYKAMPLWLRIVTFPALVIILSLSILIMCVRVEQRRRLPR